MSDVTPPVGGPVPPPPAPPGTAPWQQAPPPSAAPAAATSPAPSVPPTYQQFAGPDAPLAGFWRRAWARWITTVFWTTICAIGLGLLMIGTIFVYDASPTDIVAWSGLGICYGFGAVITYLIWSRSLATHGGTIGMRQMGLRIHLTSSRASLTREDAFKRSFIALLPLIYWTGLPLLTVFDLSDELVVLLLIIGAAITILVFLGGLWMFVSERRQTLWDVVGGTVVVTEQEPSWLAVIAFSIGLLVPNAAAMTVSLIGADRLQTEFRRVSGIDTLGRYLLYSIPGLLVAAVAITIGHLALRSTKWERQRLAGRGLARTAVLLGYAFPVGLVLALAFTLIYRRLNDDIARSCNDERKEIVVAMESYLALNGTYPRAISPIADGIYLDEPDLAERWVITTTASGSQPYRIDGIGDCDDA